MKGLALALVLTLAAGAPAFAAEGDYHIRVDGLSCPFCAYGIEKKLKQLPGVTGIEMDMEQGIVTVRMTSGAQVDEAALRRAVADAGFTPRGISREGTAP